MKMAKKAKRALFVGRFQPFHKGHLQILQKLLKQYNEVIVVIGSAEEPPNFKNPFTAGERMEMLLSCFSSKELAKLILVPVRDINDDRLWVSHLSSHIPSYSVVYSNNELVNSLFSRVNIPVKKFKLINRSQYQGTSIRKKMLDGKSWQKFLPVPVANFIQSINGIARIKKLAII